MARASWGRTHRSMSWVQRGRPSAVEAIPPMKAWGRPVPPATRMASPSTRRKVSSSTSGRVPVHSRSCGWSWSSMPVAVPRSAAAETRPAPLVAGSAGSWQRCRDMETLELLIGLLAAVAVVVRLAGRTNIPEPVLLVVAGLAVALIPGLPEVELDPQLILALFLPPLLYWAALHTDPRDLRANLRPIALLAVGLVLATTAAVAWLGHAVLGLPWAVAVVLGAIVSPPDPVAAVAVAGRLGLPRRMVTILEAEGLLNDATALVLYRVAVAAAVSGAFSLGEAGVELAVSAVGGTAVGLAVGFVGSRVLRRVSEAPVENTVKLLLPYVAWLAAERLHASGVLAVLACGLLMTRHGGAPPGPPALGLAGVRPRGAVVRARGGAAAHGGGGHRGAVPGRPGPGRPGPQPGGDRGPSGPGVPGELAAAAVGAGARTRPVPRLGLHHGDRLGGHARGGDPGPRRGHPARGGLRGALPRPQPGGVPGLLGDRGHPGRPGPDPAPGDPLAGGGGRRRGGGRRWPQGPGPAVGG